MKREYKMWAVIEEGSSGMEFYLVSVFTYESLARRCVELADGYRMEAYQCTVVVDLPKKSQ